MLPEQLIQLLRFVRIGQIRGQEPVLCFLSGTLLQILISLSRHIHLDRPIVKRPQQRVLHESSNRIRIGVRSFSDRDAVARIVPCI
ncbi:hypothetical protein D3C75_1043740 [compost metagenome]